MIESLVTSTLQSMAWTGLIFFLVAVATLSVYHRKILFLSSHGWSHRLSGGLLLLWLVLGALTCHVCAANSTLAFCFDLILGVLGISATLTAAKQFPHKLVTNEKGQSGTLHQKAIVTQAEMIEHAFYQTLNFVQSAYLHSAQRLLQAGLLESWNRRLTLLWLVTSPWLVRQWVPVHSFSDNWKVNEERTGLEIILYRIKKAQYLFYKHVILHGINIYMVITTASTPSDSSPPYSLSWRIFWLLLNTSYVMEFFLQSLVKRQTIINQSTMLWLQRLLMTSASTGAMVVLWQLSMRNGCRELWLLPTISLASMTLNFTNRHHDVLNTLTVATIAIIFRQ